MREYGKVYPRFWTGGTGKALRGDMESQVLALYLMTCPHANMIGVFHCPIIYMAHETGLTVEGASKALQRLIESGFCTFDWVDDVVWVHEMASHQVGVLSSPKDKQVLGLRKQVAQIAQPHIRQAFAARYAQDFHLLFDGENISPLQAPSKALPSQEQEQEQEQNKTLSPTALSGSTEKAPVDPDLLPCPVEKIIEAYHEAMPLNPRCKVLNDSRKRSIRQRWREASRMQSQPFGYSTQADGVNAWRQFFGVCAESEFLTGRVPGRNGAPPFVADVDFLFSPSGFAKVLENKYHREVMA